MALNIKNPEVERLAAEVARLSGETTTEAIRRALEERRDRLSLSTQDRYAALLHFLEREVWPLVPPDARGVRLSKDEEAELLGFGPGGA